MTLILTHLSKYGIIHACDANVTYSNPKTGKPKEVKEHLKIFKIPYLNAALTLAGSYSVGGILMQNWMQKFIQSQSTISQLTLGQFAANLKDALESQMLRDEKGGGSLVHIAGYVEKAGKSHPEFWFVRNVHRLKPNGEYDDFRDDFAVSEDFWGRDYVEHNLASLFQQDGYQLYINGFAEGRISYHILNGAMRVFFNSIWSNPAWKFRPPRSLEEREAFVKLYMQCITTLFESSDYDAPFIGGTIYTHSIPPPPNTVME